MARGKKHTPEQIVNVLRQIEVAIANGKMFRALDTGHGQGTIAIFNNDADMVTRWSIDSSGVAHCFLRTP